MSRFNPSIESFYKKPVGENLWSRATSSEGYINVTGELSEGAIAEERSSDYIAVDVSKQYTYSIWVTITNGNAVYLSSWTGVGFYDSNKNFISRTELTEASVPDESKKYYSYSIDTFPANTAYIRIGSRYLEDGLAKFEKGDKTAIWTPHAGDLQEKVYNDIAMIITPMSGQYPNIDRVNEKLTFYADTILVWKKGYYIISSTTDVTLVGASTTKKVLFDVTNNTFRVTSYTGESDTNEVLIATIRTLSSTNPLDQATASMMCPYTVDGKPFGILITTNPLDAFIKGAAHRGYSIEAPENTLPAYKLAKAKGFSYVETDVSWTSDGIPVLLHDSTIDRTSNGTGDISTITLATVKTYDFGSWKDARYVGTQIPTFEEFILLCKKLSLHPYIELKGTIDAAQATILVDIVRKMDMLERVSWISFSKVSLQEIDAAEPNARLGYIGTISSAFITDAATLKTATNKVFIDSDTTVTQSLVEESLLQGMSVEVWTVDDSETARTLAGYGISGITTNILDVIGVMST